MTPQLEGAAKELVVDEIPLEVVVDVSTEELDVSLGGTPVLDVAAELLVTVLETRLDVPAVDVMLFDFVYDFDIVGNLVLVGFVYDLVDDGFFVLVRFVEDFIDDDFLVLVGFVADFVDEGFFVDEGLLDPLHCPNGS
jgi:hypothetical protein